MIIGRLHVHQSVYSGAKEQPESMRATLVTDVLCAKMRVLTLANDNYNDACSRLYDAR